MNNEIILQHLIGVDKKNPNFTIFRNTSSDSPELYIYWGADLLEVVPEDKTSPAFKLSIARLYNAGIKGTALIKKFGIARTTLKRWGNAIKSNNPEKIIRALGGQGAPRKITTEIKAFIELRFSQIYRQTHYNYSNQIRNEIKDVFRISISSETLRPIFKKLKQTIKEHALPYNEKNQKQANDCDLKPTADDNLANGSNAAVADNNTGNRKHSLTFPENQKLFCNHAGILLFSTLIEDLSFYLKEHTGIIIQWIVSILLGAVNIEQTKLIDSNSMKIILGSYCKTISVQRKSLWQIVKKESIKNLSAFNVNMTDAKNYKDFYYDPHTKRYTGIKKILKGWCSSLGRADKVLDMDFIHTSAGAPIFIKHVDNFHTLRERVIKIIEEFRIAMGFDMETVLTFVIDRAIYSFDVLGKVISIKNINLITWEKGYKANQWDNSKTSGSFAITRPRNHANDLLKYEFQYLDQAWSKNNKMRQIIVQATNPKNKTIEVSILTTDKNRLAKEIIRLMFKRWIQENDFKYLIQHFGINEITSYAAIDYQKIRGFVEDKKMTSGRYKALKLHYNKVKKDLGKALFQKHINKKIIKKTSEKIEALTNEFEELKNEISNTEKEASRLETLINEEYCRLDIENKALMDNIKIICRNMFYTVFEPFRELYNNYRDDHIMFRNLTRSHGVLISKQEEVEVILFPTVSYATKMRGTVEKLLEKINQNNPKMPDGSNRRIIFKIGKKVNNLFAI